MARQRGPKKPAEASSVWDTHVLVAPGERFGLWTVVAYVPADPQEPRLAGALWLCRCDCGTERAVRAKRLRSPRGTRSCGCATAGLISASLRRHGHAQARGSKSPTYLTWRSMLARCSKPNNDNFRYYGGRGIRVHKRWRLSFDAFLADMGERPPGLSLDRIDVNGHYEPSNCRWATRATQRANQRSRGAAPLAVQGKGSTEVA